LTISLSAGCTEGACGRLFGYPGDGGNGVLGALQRANGEIEFIQVRHEEMAAFMASAHAKFTGELGVCLSTGGPGAAHLITGLNDAKCDHTPVLAISGQAPRTARGAVMFLHHCREKDAPENSASFHRLAEKQI
jgi:thiamine pyrophosphate-dependent acetolactate synthase large subunit-like protein